jgi:hypothetical protein
MQAKSLLGANIELRIQDDISSIENFLALNELLSDNRRIVPLTSSRQPFLSFSERELTHFFWRRPPLKKRLSEMAASEGSPANSMVDIDCWISGKEPGFIIKAFIADIDPTGISNRKKRKAGHRGAIELLSLDQIREHIQLVRNTPPADYRRKNYLARGSIRTDGFRMQILAFKLRERQDARFKKRDDSDHLSRLKSTVAGVDYYLSEIRNIIRSEEDIKELWPGKNVHDMKILSMDAGQACVLGGFAHLPHGLDSHGKGKEVAEGTTMEGIISNSQDAVAILNDLETLDPGSASASAPMSAHTPNSDQPGTPPRDAFYNLAVKQKAIYQPIFRFRRWLEEEKKVVPDGQEESVSDIESRLPPFRGPGASVIQYVKELEQAEQRLKAFYAGNKHQFRKHHWDMERAKQADYQAIAERLLGIIGGSLGRRVEDNKDKSPVVIGIGLGQFNSGARLSSLHSTFLTYFIKKVCGLF